MPILPDGTWEPELNPKQRLVYYDNHRMLLVSGPRLSGKTTASIKRVIRHAWEVGTDRHGAVVGVYCNTIKQGLGGVWKGLYTLLQEWVDAGVEGHGVSFSMVGKTDWLSSRGATRQYYMQIYNQFGAVAEFQLHSLEFEGDVEKKFLSTEFTCLYFSELQNFHSRSSFNIPIMQLRSISGAFPREQFMWIADTNPPEEGDAHWAYDIFWRDRLATEAPETLKTEKEIADFIQYQKDIGLIEFSIDDNPKAYPGDVAQVKNMYRDDPEGWARFVEGKWVRGIGFDGAWFARAFTERRSKIIVGNADETKKIILPEDWERLLPDKSTAMLHVGLDTGDTNQAGCILQKRFIDGMSTWDVIDEVVHIKSDVMLSEYGEELLSKMTLLEEHLGRPIEWNCWGDTSMDRFKANSIEGTDATIIQRAVDHKFFIRFAVDAKKPKMVKRRIDLLMNLIRSGRFFVSANCFATIRMLEGLRKGATEFQHIQRGDPNKHIFDAISYVIFSEMLEDNELQVNEKSTPKASKIHVPISIPM